jgi:hypothetical protein
MDTATGIRRDVETPATSWYCALFLDESRAWIAGSMGAAREVVFSGDAIESQVLDLGVHHHIYTLCRTDSTHVAVGCSHGHVFHVDAANGTTLCWSQNLGRTVRSAAARMQSILNVSIGNEIIRRFLFSPETLPPDDLAALASELRQQNLLYAAVAPDAPLLIVGSEDGIVHVLDHRDGSLVESIEATSANMADLHGICFLDAQQFGVLSRSGDVQFYSLTEVPYSRALKFVDAHELEI